jgi:predicted nucleic acid-binding protein
VSSADGPVRRYVPTVALVVASARTGGCARLLGEDLQPGRRIGDRTILDPFRTTGRTAS